MPRKGRIREKVVVSQEGHPCGNECHWPLNPCTLTDLGITGRQINLDLHNTHSLNAGKDKRAKHTLRKKVENN